MEHLRHLASATSLVDTKAIAALESLSATVVSDSNEARALTEAITAPKKAPKYVAVMGHLFGIFQESGTSENQLSFLSILSALLDAAFALPLHSPPSAEVVPSQASDRVPSVPPSFIDLLLGVPASFSSLPGFIARVLSTQFACAPATAASLPPGGASGAPAWVAFGDAALTLLLKHGGALFRDSRFAEACVSCDLCYTLLHIVTTVGAEIKETGHPSHPLLYASLDALKQLVRTTSSAKWAVASSPLVSAAVEVLQAAALGLPLSPAPDSVTSSCADLVVQLGGLLNSVWQGDAYCKWDLEEATTAPPSFLNVSFAGYAVPLPRDHPGGSVRVMVSIEYGNERRYLPVTVQHTERGQPIIPKKKNNEQNNSMQNLFFASKASFQQSLAIPFTAMTADDSPEASLRLEASVYALGQPVPLSVSRFAVAQEDVVGISDLVDVPLLVRVEEEWVRPVGADVSVSFFVCQAESFTVSMRTAALSKHIERPVMISSKSAGSIASTTTEQQTVYAVRASTSAIPDVGALARNLVQRVASRRVQVLESTASSLLNAAIALAYELSMLRIVLALSYTICTLGPELCSLLTTTVGRSFTDNVKSVLLRELPNAPPLSSNCPLLPRDYESGLDVGQRRALPRILHFPLVVDEAPSFQTGPSTRRFDTSMYFHPQCAWYILKIEAATAASCKVIADTTYPLPPISLPDTAWCDRGGTPRGTFRLPSILHVLCGTRDILSVLILQRAARRFLALIKLRRRREERTSSHRKANADTAAAEMGRIAKGYLVRKKQPSKPSQPAKADRASSAANSRRGSVAGRRTTSESRRGSVSGRRGSVVTSVSASRKGDASTRKPRVAVKPAVPVFAAAKPKKKVPSRLHPSLPASITPIVSLAVAECPDLLTQSELYLSLDQPAFFLTALCYSMENAAQRPSFPKKVKKIADGAADAKTAAVTILQSHVRRWLVVQRIQRYRTAAIAIQAVVRGRQARARAAILRTKYRRLLAMERAKKEKERKAQFAARLQSFVEREDALRRALYNEEAVGWGGIMTRVRTSTRWAMQAARPVTKRSTSPSPTGRASTATAAVREEANLTHELERVQAEIEDAFEDGNKAYGLRMLRYSVHLRTKLYGVHAIETAEGVITLVLAVIGIATQLTQQPSAPGQVPPVAETSRPPRVHIISAGNVFKRGTSDAPPPQSVMIVTPDLCKMTLTDFKRQLQVRLDIAVPILQMYRSSDGAKVSSIPEFAACKFVILTTKYTDWQSVTQSLPEDILESIASLEQEPESDAALVSQKPAAQLGSALALTKEALRLTERAPGTVWGRHDGLSEEARVQWVALDAVRTLLRASSLYLASIAEAAARNSDAAEEKMSDCLAVLSILLKRAQTAEAAEANAQAAAQMGSDDAEDLKVVHQRARDAAPISSSVASAAIAAAMVNLQALSTSSRRNTDAIDNGLSALRALDPDGVVPHFVDRLPCVGADDVACEPAHHDVSTRITTASEPFEVRSWLVEALSPSIVPGFPVLSDMRGSLLSLAHFNFGVALDAKAVASKGRAEPVLAQALKAYTVAYRVASTLYPPSHELVVTYASAADSAMQRLMALKMLGDGKVARSLRARGGPRVSPRNAVPPKRLPPVPLAPGQAKPRASPSPPIRPASTSASQNRSSKPQPTSESTSELVRRLRTKFLDQQKPLR